MSELDRLQIFYGESSQAIARIYARLPAPSPPSTWRLAGHIRGPYSSAGRTLPSSTPLRSLERLHRAHSAGDLLAGADLPDPCFWSPSIPSLYHAHVELREGSQTMETIDRPLGIRHFGIRGGCFCFEGRPWTPLAVNQRSVDEPDLARWKEHQLTMVLQDPSDAICRAASELGIVVIARPLAGPAECMRQVGQFARWAAVSIVVLRQEQIAAVDDLKSAAPNLVLAQDCCGTEPLAVRPWAEAAVCEVRLSADSAQPVAEGTVPMIAESNRGPFRALPDALAACNDLRNELAPHGKPAGYCVG